MSDVIFFCLMIEVDFDVVLKIEYVVFSYFWICGIFSEGLKNYYCWLMFEGSQQVGYGVIQIIFDEVYLLNIMVKFESQGCGFGLCLFEYLMCEVVGYQVCECFFEVCVFNQVVYCFYECYGFNEIGCCCDYYFVVGGCEDVLVMVCILFD